MEVTLTAVCIVRRFDKPINSFKSEVRSDEVRRSEPVPSDATWVRGCHSLKSINRGM